MQINYLISIFSWGGFVRILYFFDQESVSNIILCFNYIFIIFIIYLLCYIQLYYIILYSISGWCLGMTHWTLLALVKRPYSQQGPEGTFKKRWNLDRWLGESFWNQIRYVRWGSRAWQWGATVNTKIEFFKPLGVSFGLSMKMQAAFVFALSWPNWRTTREINLKQVEIFIYFN